MEGKTIKIITRNEEETIIEIVILKPSETLTDLVNGIQECNCELNNDNSNNDNNNNNCKCFTVPLKNVSKCTLNQIITFLNFRYQHPINDKVIENDTIEDKAIESDAKFQKIEDKANENDTQCFKLSKNLSFDQVCELIKAANYLGIVELVKTCAEHMAEGVVSCELDPVKELAHYGLEKGPTREEENEIRKSHGLALLEESSDESSDEESSDEKSSDEDEDSKGKDEEE